VTGEQHADTVRRFIEANREHGKECCFSYTALEFTDLDALLAENAVLVAWKQEALKALDARLAENQRLRDALTDLLNNMGGHEHWREGGAGGTCATCVQQRKAATRAREALRGGDAS
jgi:hypothetical protein